MNEVERLKSIAIGLQGQQQSPVFKALGQINKEAQDTIATTVRTGPKSLALLTTSTFANAANDLAKSKPPREAAFFTEAVKQLGATDPGNAREVKEAFDAVNTLAKKSPELSRVGNTALRVLREQGVVGDSILADTLEWMVVATGVVALGGSLLSEIQKLQSKKTKDVAQLVIQAGPLSIRVNELGDFNGSYVMTKPKWLGSSLSISVKGKRGKVTDVSVGIPVVVPVGRWSGVQVVVRPSVQAARDSGVEIGGQVSLRKATRQGAVKVSSYATAGIQSGLREGGVKATVRFGWSDGVTPGSVELPNQKPVALVGLASLLLLAGRSG